MNFERIAFDCGEDGIARITLQDPATRNAYTLAMCREILEAIADFANRDAARVLVITGTGGAFCSGGNLQSANEMEIGESRVFGHAAVLRESMHAVNLGLQRLDKPTIAMIDGPAVAGGLALALSCDFRIASDRARLGDPSGRAGLLPDEGGAWLWPRVMGLERALRMTLFGEIYDASEALRLGLIGEVVPSDRLETRVEEFASTLAAKAPLVVRAVKRMMHRGLEQSFEQSLGDVSLVVDFINHSEDAREGIAAFRDKRAPRFQGK
jgi:2-(1,2-epoxy-1,2-dihydrophenyl)acetyl-CoA isomerase